jgi:hypothetical protein
MKKLLILLLLFIGHTTFAKSTSSSYSDTIFTETDITGFINGTFGDSKAQVSRAHENKSYTLTEADLFKWGEAQALGTAEGSYIDYDECTLVWYFTSDDELCAGMAFELFNPLLGHDPREEGLKHFDGLVKKISSKYGESNDEVDNEEDILGFGGIRTSFRTGQISSWTKFWIDKDYDIIEITIDSSGEVTLAYSRIKLRLKLEAEIEKRKAELEDI